MKRRNNYLNHECWEYKQHAGMVGLLFVVARRPSMAGDGMGLVFSRSRSFDPLVSTFVRRVEEVEC